MQLVRADDVEVRRGGQRKRVTQVGEQTRQRSSVQGEVQWQGPGRAWSKWQLRREGPVQF